MDSDWPFDQAPNVIAITTRRVLDEGYPILSVVHYEDDDSWAFTCGTFNETSDGRCICMSTAMRIDPTLGTIADLKPGWQAIRDEVGGEWHRYQSEFDDEDK